MGTANGTANTAVSGYQFINLLPVVHQTDALTRFFGSTVDQVFQPGTFTPINGYVGQYPSYYNSVTEFYLIDPNDPRSNYQLTPGMISLGNSANVAYSLVYPDLIGYLAAQGAITTQQSRMFENDCYSWCPPLDIDKLCNYSQYCWFGDYSGNELPILTLTPPIAVTLADGLTNSFALPDSINTITSAQETIAAYVNGVKVSDLSITANTVTLPLTPHPADTVALTRHDDLAVAIEGQLGFPLTGLLSNAITVPALTSGMRIRLQDTKRIFGGFSSTVLLEGSTIPLQVSFDQTYLSEGTIHDRAGFDPVHEGVFMVDGVGRGIRLTPDHLILRELGAQYVTIDRSSRDRNHWSLTNAWVHRDSFAWSGLSFANLQASRPIIEFSRDLLLYNYGTTRITAIDGVLSTPTATLNGSTPIPFSAIAGQINGTVQVDNATMLFAGMRLLVAQKTLAIQQLYQVGLVNGTLSLTALTQTQGDIATIRHASGYGPAGTEMHFNQGVWQVAQAWTENADPLFALCDLNGVALDDPTTYPNSDFAGNRIFGFAAGSGPADAVLQRALQYDNNGYIVFENDLATHLAAVINSGIATPIICMYCYQTQEMPGMPQSLWHRMADATVQDILTLGSAGMIYYNLPLNLTANPQTDEVSYISQACWLNHFQQLIGSQVGLIGNPLSDNNYRDTAQDVSLGSQILQHVAPMLKVMLLASEPKFDYFAALRFVDLQYSLFRNQFVRKLVSLDLAGSVASGTSAAAWVGIVLAALKINRNASFPFFLSTMAGGQYFIPATPAFLGLLPATQPALISDDTYPTPVAMILGHDGSLTPAYNDWRDEVLLALEQQIYDSIPSQYVSLERPLFDLEYYLAGRFCPSGTGAFVNYDSPYTSISYKRGEVQTMLAPIFERWVQTAGLDYRSNTSYDSIEPFTWNYHGVADRFGSLLPGHWKAIYRWYYDTERPHATPWAMLGFANQPIWWTSQYGPPPYGRDNTALWSDLEAGLIRQGPRAGINLRYARPGLSAVIPVDVAGNLLNPVAAGIVPIPPDVARASANWQIGDGGPVENIWITSPSYRYALAQIAFMTKPARLVEMVWDSLHEGFSSLGGQWIDFRTLARPTDANTLVHGEIDINGAYVTIYGIQQWISDYLVSAGLTAAPLGTAIRGLDVRLIQRMGGFITSDDLSVVADNFGVLPSEDVQIVLYQPPNTDTEVYSGVIVEWTGHGWRVIGYDARDPYFTVIPPDTFGPKGVITLSDVPEPVIVPWSPHTYYRAEQMVTFKGITYQSSSAHTSGPVFAAASEISYWTVVPGTYPQAPRVIAYLNGIMDATQTVAYGTVFTTIQQVADFLLGWERWLLTRGWTFDVMGPTGLNNWSAAVKQFLSWQQVNWAVGNFIALSPGANELHFSAATGTVLNVEDTNTGFFGLLDRASAPINSRAIQLSRLGGNLKFLTQSADIFCARVRIVNIEHALIFSNLTIFNDPVYLPLYNMQQARLKILGNLTSDWTGRLNAPGFIIEGSSVVPSFARNAEDVEVMFDIEKSLRKDFTDFARHNIGYQPRDYLQDLLLAEVEQFEFYQGMIQQKGAPGVFSALLRSTRVSASSDIQFLEEFAIRYPRFGGPIPPRISFLLAQSSVHGNPVFIRLGNYAQLDPSWIILSANSTAWIDQPAPNKPFFPLLAPPDPLAPRGPMIPTIGPVRLSDVQYSLFHTDDLAVYYTNALANGANSLDLDDGTTGIFATGQRVWIYQDDATLRWNMYEAFELGSYPNYITYTITADDDPSVQGLRLFFAYPTGLTIANEGDYIIIDGMAYTSPEIQGVQTIEVVNTISNYIDIDVDGLQGYSFLSNTNGERAEPNVRILQSVRFANVAALNASPLMWSSGDLVWVDHDPSQANLATVYQYTANTITGVVANAVSNAVSNDMANPGWTLLRVQPPKVDPRAIDIASLYDISTQITINGSIRQITTNEPVIDDLVLVDPLAGVFAGAGRKEVDFLTPFDPARYSNSIVASTALDAWGDAEVGRVWWDVSTVRYLEPYTDQIGISDARDLAEINNRITYWSTIAPGTSVDVYEWTKSDLTPLQYMNAAAGDTTGSLGTVYTGYDGVLTDTPSYAQHAIYSSAFNTDVTYYYFWVKGLSTVPNVPFRSTPVADIATILQSPTAQDIPWFAPIMQDGMLISGLVPYLNDTSTVLKVETSNQTNDQGHGQWFLMRPGDETSLPPDWLWRALTNSLAQFDEAVNPLPSPSLSPYRAVGILPTQNMFKIDQSSAGDRLGLLGARRSMVGIINTIWAQNPIVIQRPLTIAALSRSTPIAPLLSWIRPDPSYVIEPPPANEWDYQVTSQSERNRLVLRPEFIAAATAGTTLRVLINGTHFTTPQWSIWSFGGTIAKDYVALAHSQGQPVLQVLFDNADTIFTLATSYDVSVASHAARNALTDLAIGTRVYVERDETASEFWVIYAYQPADSAADANGFIVHRVQSYRTSDFYSIVDWYAQNFNTGTQTITFSANNPPQISYASSAAAIAAQGRNPVNVFVAIIPPTGGWFWQYYANGVWTTVAQQAATIALSAQFYNSIATIHAVNTIQTTTIANRDGSWELKVLADAARGNATLIDSEVNQVFFSMIHYVHAQQDDVDWIFKTSFMTVAGYAIPLLQTTIVQEDVSNSLISFIDEVKPYHVKLRAYTAQYTPPIDPSSFHATDFDKPVYFDSTINAYRVLNPALSADLAILSGQLPWQDWYLNYATPMTRNADGFWLNPVRHLKLTLAFDRVADIDSGFDRTGFAVIGFDLNESAGGTALDRIADDYTPLSGMPPLDPPNLINTLYRYPSVPIRGNALANASYDVDYLGVIDQSSALGMANGLTEVAVSINPNSLPPGHDPAYGRIDPATRLATNRFIDPTHPQERLATITDDALSMVVRSQGAPGAPAQTVRAFRSIANTSSFVYGRLAQSADGAFVYLDGLRASLGQDYTVDHFGQSITLLANADQVAIRVFGFGGRGGIVEQHLVSFDPAQPMITLTSSPAPACVQVIIDGMVQNTTAFTLNSNTVSLAPVPAANSDVAVIVWDSPVANTCQPRMQRLDLSAGQSGALLAGTANGVGFALLSPDTWTIPAAAGTIVEADGRRLLPPLTYYGTFDPTHRSLGVEFDIDLATQIDLMIDGIYYANVTVPRWNGVRTDGGTTGNPFNLVTDLTDLPDESVPGDFVIYDRFLVALDPTFMARDVMVVFYQAGLVEYQMSANTVVIAQDIVADATTIQVTTFSNAEVLGIKTRTYFASLAGQYPSHVPYDEAASLISVNGRALVPQIDYDFAAVLDNFGQTVFGTAFGDQVSGTMLTIPLDPAATTRLTPVIATIFTGPPAQPPSVYRAATTTPAAQRMAQALTSGGWDTDYFDAPFGRFDTQAWQFDYPRQQQHHNTNPVQVYQMDGKWEFTHQSILNTGVLVADLGPCDNSITVALNLERISPRLWPIALMPIANTDAWEWSGEVFALPDVANNQPGVVWIGGERIEYFSLSYDPATTSAIPSPLMPPNVILSDLRRGTRGTPSETENRLVSVVACDGVTTLYAANASGCADVQVLRGTANSMAWTSYFLTLANTATLVAANASDHAWPTLANMSITNSAGTVVTMDTAPPAGAFVVLGVTINTAHPAGTPVADGSMVFQPQRFARHAPDRLHDRNLLVI